MTNILVYYKIKLKFSILIGFFVCSDHHKQISQPIIHCVNQHPPVCATKYPHRRDTNAIYSVISISKNAVQAREWLEYPNYVWPHLYYPKLSVPPLGLGDFYLHNKRVIKSSVFLIFLINWVDIIMIDCHTTDNQQWQDFHKSKTIRNLFKTF